MTKPVIDTNELKNSYQDIYRKKGANAYLDGARFEDNPYPIEEYSNRTWWDQGYKREKDNDQYK